MAVKVVLKMPVYLSSARNEHRPGCHMEGRLRTDQVPEIKYELLGGLPEVQVLGHVLEIDPADSRRRCGLGRRSPPCSGGQTRPQVRSGIRRRRLTNFGVPKIHDGKAIELPTLADNAEVEHNAVEFTARRGVVP